MKTNNNVERISVAVGQYGTVEMNAPAATRKVSAVTGKPMTKRQNAAYGYILGLKMKVERLTKELAETEQELRELANFILR
jgi:hypothetical protein